MNLTRIGRTLLRALISLGCLTTLLGVGVRPAIAGQWIDMYLFSSLTGNLDVNGINWGPWPYEQSIMDITDPLVMVGQHTYHDYWCYVPSGDDSGALASWVPGQPNPYEGDANWLNDPPTKSVRFIATANACLGVWNGNSTFFNNGIDVAGAASDGFGDPCVAGAVGVWSIGDPEVIAASSGTHLITLDGSSGVITYVSPEAHAAVNSTVTGEVQFMAPVNETWIGDTVTLKQDDRAVQIGYSTNRMAVRKDPTTGQIEIDNLGDILYEKAPNPPGIGDIGLTDNTFGPYEIKYDTNQSGSWNLSGGNFAWTDDLENTSSTGSISAIVLNPDPLIPVFKVDYSPAELNIYDGSTESLGDTGQVDTINLALTGGSTAGLPAVTAKSSFLMNVHRDWADRLANQPPIPNGRLHDHLAELDMKPLDATFNVGATITIKGDAVSYDGEALEPNYDAILTAADLAIAGGVAGAAVPAPEISAGLALAGVAIDKIADGVKANSQTWTAGPESASVWLDYDPSSNEPLSEWNGQRVRPPGGVDRSGLWVVSGILIYAQFIDNYEFIDHYDLTGYTESDYVNYPKFNDHWDLECQYSNKPRT